MKSCISLRSLVLGVLFLCLSSSLPARQRPTSPGLATITIVDRNGFSETISVPDRLKQFEKVNFMQPSPYEKVVRVFKRNQNGDIRSIITNYYANGQIKQYLEALNGRAHGHYREWHSNGKIKLSVGIVGGTADTSEGSEASWQFDGVSQAWDEEGNLLAEIPYNKGELEGISKYFHPNKMIWKSIPYHQNFPHGCTEIFLSNGNLLQKTSFSQGLLHGDSIRYWKPGLAASKESYQSGKLISGQYFDLSGKLVSEVIEGTGKRAVFSKDYIMEYQQYKNGELDGEVDIYNKEGKLIRNYFVKNGKKEGPETFYYETLSAAQPKLSLEWKADQIQGLVKTWYPNGNQESQREFSRSQKSGHSIAWYQDGNIMLIEEYLNEKLLKGEYFKKGEKKPISRIAKGNGIAYIYDSEGNFIHKLDYANGKPIPNE